MSFALTLAAAFAAFVALMLVFQRQLVYFPQVALDLEPGEVGLRHEEVLLDAGGVAVHGWLLPVEGARFTVLVCHGNAGNISHRLDRAARLQRQLNASVLLFDYRGYGRSEGSPDEEGTYQDARAAYRFLTGTRGLPPESIVLFGESLGAAVAVQLALEQPALALVLESPFTSVPDMARAAYPFLPPLGPLIRIRYDTLAKAGRLTLPLLVLHGDRDAIVPIAQGRRVFEAASGPKRFFAIPGAGHNDTYLTGGDPYWQVLREFLDAGDAGPGGAGVTVRGSAQEQ